MNTYHTLILVVDCRLTNGSCNWWSRFSLPGEVIETNMCEWLCDLLSGLDACLIKEDGCSVYKKYYILSIRHCSCAHWTLTGTLASLFFKVSHLSPSHFTTFLNFETLWLTSVTSSMEGNQRRKQYHNHMIQCIPFISYMCSGYWYIRMIRHRNIYYYCIYCLLD